MFLSLILAQVLAANPATGQQSPITATTCSAGQFVTSLSTSAVGGCTVITGPDIASGTVNPDRLGSGGGAGKYLRYDSTWQTIAGGGDLLAANNLSDVANAATSLSNLGGEPAGTFSGIGACGANQWASTLNDGAAPTCTQPGFSNLSGSATDAQIPNTITLDNLTQITTRAIADTTGILAVDRGGTGAAPGAGDQLLVSDSTSAATWKALNDCTGAGKALTYVASSNTFGCNTISAGGGPQLTFLAADSALSTVTKTNLTGMSYTLSASTNYSWECHMFTTANATTVGVQFAITFGGTVTNVRSMFQGPGAATTLLWSSDTSFQVDHNPTASQGNVAGIVVLTGTVEVSGSGGTLQFQHGSETATLTTVQRGSWCRLYTY